MRKGIVAAVVLGALTTLAHGSVSAKPAKLAKRVDLSVYLGKSPYDVVGGYRFFDNPVVKAAVARSVLNARQRATITVEDGDLTVPIRKVAGGRILAWAGTGRAADPVNWAVVIAPNGSKPEICIFEGVGFDDNTPSSRWFTPPHSDLMKLGQCPSRAEEYPPNEISAG